MRRTFTCILCPNGCEIECEFEGRKILSVVGYGCEKGRDYAEQELRSPRRTVASLVRVRGGDQELASVRLDKPVPRERIPDVMEEIRRAALDAPVRMGQVAIPNVLGLGSDVIVTRNVGSRCDCGIVPGREKLSNRHGPR
jgi:CxxC motif-containing protein